MGVWRSSRPAQATRPGRRTHEIAVHLFVRRWAGAVRRSTQSRSTVIVSRVNDFGVTDALPLGRRLAYTHKVVHDLADGILRRAGADMITWIVLFQAQQHGGGLAFSQRELAQGLHMSGPALVRHLDRLEADDLVRRQRDEHDRRITRITLTPRGKRLLARLKVIMADADRDLRSCLTAAEARTLERALAKLHAYALAEHPDAGDPSRSTGPALREHPARTLAHPPSERRAHDQPSPGR
jgi:DNA-binding MarR family transcriptional regulator